MIKINLLEKKNQQKERTSAPKFLVNLGLLTGIVLALAVVAVLGILWHISSLKDQSESNKKEIAQLKQKITEVQRYEKMNKEFEQNVSLIEGLRKNQAVPVKLLDEMSSLLTSAEGVWLASMSYRGGAIEMEGLSFTNESLVSFVDMLKKSALVAEVDLKESVRAVQDKVPVYKFKLNCKFRM